VVADGKPRFRVHVVQFDILRNPGLAWIRPAFYFHPVFGAMAGNGLGHHPSGRWVETDKDRHPPVGGEHRMDDPVHCVLEVNMDEMKYELLVELNSRMEADLLKSYLESQEIPVELFQESVGQNIYPVTLSTLGIVQVFVPKEKFKQAKKALELFLKKN